MTTLKPLDQVGIDTHFFHLAQSEAQGQEVTYFVFDEGWPVKSMSSWELIGVSQQTGNPTLISVRLIHIEEEMLQWPPFIAPRDAPGYVVLSPSRLDATIAFLESLSTSFTSQQPAAVSYFIPLESSALPSLGFPAKLPPGIFDTETEFYRYISDPAKPGGEDISIVILSGWSTSNAQTALMTITFMGFNHDQLADPTFNPLEADGLGLLRFDRRAIPYLVSLLQRHSFA